MLVTLEKQQLARYEVVWPYPEVEPPPTVNVRTRRETPLTPEILALLRVEPLTLRQIAERTRSDYWTVSSLLRTLDQRGTFQQKRVGEYPRVYRLAAGTQEGR